MQPTSPTPTPLAQSGTAKPCTVHPDRIHLGADLGDVFCFQLLDSDNRSVASLHMRPDGSVAEMGLSLLDQHESGLFVAGCRNVVLAKGGLSYAHEKAAALIASQRAARNANL